MHLGQKLKRERLNRGLSQRQLCGDVITRNMLSLIENGTASPSMETLRYLSGQLGKPMSYFLDEEVVISPNQSVMEQARRAFQQGAYDQTLRELERYSAPDGLFDWEAGLLRVLSLLALAEEAISLGKGPYGLELLSKAADAGVQTPYYTPDLQRRHLLLQAQLIPTQLPTDDRELLLRSEAALKQKNPEDAARYLEAAQVRSGPYWNYLRGQAYLMTEDYSQARSCLEAAWEHDPKACAGFLEQCCRELEDFKGAYRYACFLRDHTN